MVRFRTLSPLALYLGLLLGVGAVVVVSLNVVADTLGSLDTTNTPKIEAGLKRANVPLPPVIRPDIPKLERRLSRRDQNESSFVIIGGPSEQQEGTTIGLPEDSQSIVELPAPSDSR